MISEDDMILNINEHKVKNWSVIIYRMKRPESLVYFFEKTITLLRDPEEIAFFIHLVYDRLETLEQENLI